MNKFDTTPLRQLLRHLGIEPLYVLPPLAISQMRPHPPHGDLPGALIGAVDSLRDLAIMSRDYVQIGLFEFHAGLDFFDAEWVPQAVEHFEAARRQWLFIDHLPLISLAYLGKGMAHFSAGDHPQAEAAYFNVKRCLQQAEQEPHRWEKWEAERSLQEFWHELERWLMQAISSLRRDFDDELERTLRLASKGAIDTESDGESADAGSSDSPLNLVIQLWPTGALSAPDVYELICKTIAAIEALNEAMHPPAEDHALPALVVGKLNYGDQDTITIELTNVSTHVLAFWHKLLALNSSVPGGTDLGKGQMAESRRASFGEPLSGADDSERSWFTLETGSGRIAALIKTYLAEKLGRMLDDDETRRLVQAIKHLVELKENCQLTLKSVAS